MQLFLSDGITEQYIARSYYSTFPISHNDPQPASVPVLEVDEICFAGNVEGPNMYVFPFHPLFSNPASFLAHFCYYHLIRSLRGTSGRPI